MKRLVVLPLLWWAVARAEDPVCTLTTNGEYGESNQSAFLPEHADHWDPAHAPQEGIEYFVINGKSLYTPYVSDAGSLGADVVFGGDKLTLGDDSSAGYLYNQTYAVVRIPKLTVVNGVYYSCGAWTGNRYSYLDSEITIAATDWAKASFQTGAKWQSFFLRGKLIGDATAKMRMMNVSDVAATMGLASDCSEYFGAFVANPQSWVSGAQNFYLDTTYFPGTLLLGGASPVPDAGSTFEFHVYATNGCAVSSLALNRTMRLHLNFDVETWESKPIVVDASFSEGCPMTLVPKAVGGDPRTLHPGLKEDVFVPLLKVKKAAGPIDMTKITLGKIDGLSDARQKYFVLQLRTDDPEYDVVGLYHEVKGLMVILR